MTRIDHTTHDHANTKAARALCRRMADQAQGLGLTVAEAPNTVSIHTVIDQATEAYVAEQAVASITAPNGTVIREGDIVTLSGSKIERRVKDITKDAIRAVRTDGSIVAASKWTKQLNGVKVISA